MHPLALALLAFLCLLLVAGIVTDVRARVIPNALTAAVALLAVPWWWASGLTGHDILWQVVLAAGMLVVFAGCFAIGMMGGGDVKLIVALALWLPPAALAVMLVWMAIGGGVLTLGMVVAHRLRRSGAKLEIPYGVAIAGAALMIVANEILTSPLA